MSDQLTNPAGAFLSFQKDLDDIKRKLDGKVPFLLTEEAVEGFRTYLAENAKPNTVRNLQGFLGKFSTAFPTTNMAELPPVTLQEFLALNWGKGKRSTLKLAYSHLKWFYAWSIKYSQRKGRPPFPNPCDFIEVKNDSDQKKPEFIPVEKMKEFLATAKTETHWLMFAILMTAGLRASELVGDAKAGKKGLLKKDIDGRVLTVTNPKSGKISETAVIPEWVAARLNEYAKGLAPDDRVFEVSYSTLYDVITTHAEWVGLDIVPHYLRKWVASFWQRQGEYSMTNFILRHSSSKVNDATLIKTLGWEAMYVVPLSPEEVAEKQDKHLAESIFK